MKSVGLIVSAAALVLAAVAVAGEDGGGQTAKPEKVKNAEPEVLQDIVVTGVVGTSQKQTKDGKTVDVFTLTDATGTVIPLPTPRAPKEKGVMAVPVINLKDYVGKTVTVSGQGTEKEKKGVKKVHIRNITKVEEAVVAPAPALAPAPAEPVKAEPEKAEPAAEAK